MNRQELKYRLSGVADCVKVFKEQVYNVNKQLNELDSLLNDFSQDLDSITPENVKALSTALEKVEQIRLGSMGVEDQVLFNGGQHKLSLFQLFAKKL